MSQNPKTATYLFFFGKSHPLIPGLTVTYLFSPSVNPVQLPAFLLNLLKLRTWNQCVYHVHTHSVHGVHTHCEPSASAADESRSAPFAFRHFSILHTCVYKLNLKHVSFSRAAGWPRRSNSANPYRVYVAEFRNFLAICRHAVD